MKLFAFFKNQEIVEAILELMDNTRDISLKAE